MDKYVKDAYDAGADTYDEMFGTEFDAQDVEAATAFLAKAAAGGRALELGIGSGRVALPLAARGVEVHGIDGSASMVARLRAKPGGDAVPVTMGDFADVAVPGRFDLIYVVFNTFQALTTGTEQARCLTNVAARLRPDGRLVVEGLVPDPARLSLKPKIHVAQMDAERVHLIIARTDPVTQVADAQHVLLTTAGVKLLPLRTRYTWPSELDLMCRLAGLDLRHRFGGWQGEPFTATSRTHVSVYAPGAPPPD